MLAPCGGLKFKDDDFKVENGEVALKQALPAMLSAENIVGEIQEKRIEYMPPSRAKSADELERNFNHLLQLLIDSGLMKNKDE